MGLYLRMKLGDTEVFQSLKESGDVAEAPIRTMGRRDGASVAISFALSSITGATRSPWWRARCCRASTP